ncbi:MAG TPA: hypothetical protein VII42_07905 [Caulobacteraceae bacterium]|jgi:hypothetical protein
MRNAFLAVAGLVLVAACSKAPANTQSAVSAAPQSAVAPSAAAAASAAPTAPAAGASGPAISGSYTADGKPAVLTQVTAHKDDPFDGTPVTALVFTAKDQGGDDKAAFDALFDKFGDAMVIKVEPDGTVIGADIVHSALKSPSGSVSIAGVFTIKDYQATGGQISGHLTTGGPTDVFGQKVDVDLTFHTKAP